MVSTSEPPSVERLPWIRRTRGRLLTTARLLAVPLAAYTGGRVIVLMGQAVSGLGVRPASYRSAFLRYDASWYLRAARSGYPAQVVASAGRAQQSTIAFFPLYPMLVRLVARVTGLEYTAAAQLVVTLAGVASVVAVWFVVRRVWGKDVADRTAVLFCFFPGFMVWGMGYAEPVTVALAAACLLALLEQRWLVAGLCAAAATAARPNAAVLVLCCVVAAVVAARRERRLGPLIAPLLAPAGWVAFMVFLWQRTGDLGAWQRVEHDGWNQHFDGGLEVLRRVRQIFTQPFAAPFGALDALVATGAVVVAIGLGWALWRSRAPLVLLVYSYALVVLSLGWAGLGVRPRFVETAFPLLAALAVRVRAVPLAITVAVAAGALLALTVITTSTVYVTP